MQYNLNHITMVEIILKIYNWCIRSTTSSYTIYTFITMQNDKYARWQTIHHKSGNTYYSSTHKKDCILFSSQTHKQTKRLHGILVCKFYARVCFSMDPIFFRNTGTPRTCVWKSLHNTALKLYGILSDFFNGFNIWCVTLFFPIGSASGRKMSRLCHYVQD
jgi:hypothetical protein